MNYSKLYLYFVYRWLVTGYDVHRELAIRFLKRKIERQKNEKQAPYTETNIRNK